MGRLVKYITLCAFLILNLGCVAIYKVDILEEPKQHQVYKDQYIISRVKADGPFNPWHVGAEGTKTLPAGTYLISSVGEYELISDSVGILTESTPVPYNKEEDLCLDVKMIGVSCSPNYVINGVLNTDPHFNKLWGLKNPPGVDVASITSDKRAPNVKVMVLDTGVNCEHEDIECTAIGYNTITGGQTSESARDDNGHGSHVSGTIAAIGGNGKGISGVTTYSPIVPAKFLAANGSGSLYNAIKAVQWARAHGIDIINASFGGGGYSEPFQEAINQAADDGILFMAAAGNSNENNDRRPHYPSNYDNVLSVASITSRGKLSSFSNYGAATVHIAAPGSDIYSLDYRGGYKSLNGTSMATPHAAGVAALLYQRNKDRPRKERRSIAWEKITSTARPEHLDKLKYGVLDAKAALGGEAGCDREQCKNCLRQCAKNNKCKCKKQKVCKKDCRAANNCSVGCR